MSLFCFSTFMAFVDGIFKLPHKHQAKKSVFLYTFRFYEWQRIIRLLPESPLYQAHCVHHKNHHILYECCDTQCWKGTINGHSILSSAIFMRFQKDNIITHIMEVVLDFFYCYYILCSVVWSDITRSLPISSSHQLYFVRICSYQTTTKLYNISFLSF